MNRDSTYGCAWRRNLALHAGHVTVTVDETCSSKLFNELFEGPPGACWCGFGGSIGGLLQLLSDCSWRGCCRRRMANCGELVRLMSLLREGERRYTRKQSGNDKSRAVVTLAHLPQTKTIRVASSGDERERKVRQAVQTG